MRERDGNMSQYAKTVPDCSSQSINHLISDSPWDERAVIDHIQRDVDALIGDPENASIHIDESGFPKQGKRSIGVKRQYCGRIGKVENCQVGVFLGMANGSNRMLIDGRLYLPKEWTDDPILRSKGGIPDDVVFKTKAEIGLEMVQNARKNGVRFGYVGMDCFYGEQPLLRERLDSEGLKYIADIPCDTRVWLKLPQIGIPERNGNRGRIPSKVKVIEKEANPIEVSKLKEAIDPSQWKRVFVRDTEREELWVDIACMRIFPVQNSLPGKEVWLIIRKDDAKNIVKYQFSNAPIDTSIEKLAKMSCSRYWIERTCSIR
jgi:SRSO17 transposase